MSEVELLPLPEPGESMSKWAYHEADMEAYARANMEPLIAENERLAEALRGLKDLMMEQVKWEPCDCGCPQQRTPDGPHSVTWLRAAQQVEIAISKAEENDDA